MPHGALFFFTVTLLGTNISHFDGTFEDDFPIPQVGYVNSLVDSHDFSRLKSKSNSLHSSCNDVSKTPCASEPWMTVGNAMEVCRF